MKNSLYILVLLIAVTSCKKDDPQPEPTPSDPTHPISLDLESIVLTGFSLLDTNGDHWDEAGNKADPYIEIRKDGTLVYTSVRVPNADNETSFPMNTADSGSIPITFTEGQSLELSVLNFNSSTDSDFMAGLTIDDTYNFFYNGDSETGFTDVFVSTTTSDITFLMSGAFDY